MAATLLLGTLDLSSYLDLAPGDGADPAAPDYSQRIIGHSILREGGTFAREDRGVKTLNFPLYLKAASKSALHALVQTINQALDTANQTVTWTDEGASQPTIFDAVTGQLDIAYDFRRAQHFYLHATLRLYVQPFGRAASRTLASLSGTGPVMVLSTPSPILGDVPAQLIANMSEFTLVSKASTVARTLAFSVLPGPSYRPQITASDLPSFPTTFTGWTVVGASGAVARTYRRVSVSSTAQLASAFGSATAFALATIPFPPGLYSGNNRILFIGRAAGGTTFVPPTIPLWISDGKGNANLPIGVGGASLSSPTSWQLCDLGVANSDPNFSNASACLVLWTSGHSIASVSLDLTGVIILPEDQTVYISDAAQDRNNSPNYGTLDPNPNDNYLISGPSSYAARTPPLPQFSTRDITSYLRGAVPQADAGATVTYFAAMMFGGAGGDSMHVSITAIERTRYAF